MTTAAMKLPERYRHALYHTVDDAMPSEWIADLSDWLYHNRMGFQRGGDVKGANRFNYEFTDVDEECDLISEFRSALLEHMPEALKPCEVDEFAVNAIECHATLYHHKSHFCWHNDDLGQDGEPVATRRIGFAYYIHSVPKLFSGGQLEFIDGTRIEPDANRLVFFNPHQQHRVTPVECWSKDALDGRWALCGWVHEPAKGE